jgi:16S rRNA processing protein RimM
MTIRGARSNPDAEHEQATEHVERGTDAFSNMVLVGRVARPHGLKGHVFVNPETDFVDERFAPGARLWTQRAGGEALLVVTSMRVQGGRPVLAFDGISRVEDAERLAGLELRVPEDTLHRLEPGTYYEHQLAGCDVMTAGGERVGSVARVEGGAGAPTLVVNGTRGEVLVPLASDICREIDVEAKRIVVEPPDGLLELNEKTGDSEVRRRHDFSADDRSRARGRGRRPRG